MDVRHTPEQRPSGAPPRNSSTASDRGPVGELDDLERAAKLDAAVAATGWRELRTVPAMAHRGPPASRSPSSPRSWHGDSPTPRSSADPRRGPPPPRRCPRRRRPETVALGPISPPATPGGVAVAIDAAASGALLLAPDGTIRTRRAGRRRRRRGHRSHPADLPRSDSDGEVVGELARRRRASLDGPGARHDDRRPGRDDAGRARPGRRLRQGTLPVRRPDRLLPGRRPHARRGLVHLEGSRTALSTRHGRSTPSNRRTPSPRRLRPRPTPRERPVRCARSPSRSTAASATPGSAWRTCTSAAPSSPPTSSAASARTSPACSPTPGRHQRRMRS